MLLPLKANADSWVTKTAMPTPRQGAIAGVIGGKLYVIGGQDDSGGLTVCERYDPGTDSWETLDPAPLGFSNTGGAVIGDKLYVMHFGGLWVYDPGKPVAEQWEEKAVPPDSFAQAAVGAIGGKLYVVGGTVGSSGDHTSKRCLEYDPVADSWTEKTSMQYAREACASAVHGGKLYVFGGMEYDSIVIFPGPRPGATRITKSGAPGDGFHVGTCEVYDPATDTWSTIANLPIVNTVAQYRINSTAQVLGNKIYLVGGENQGGVLVDACLEYNPATDTWASEYPTEFALSQARRGPASGVINEKMYVVGGFKNEFPGVYYTTNEELDGSFVPVSMSLFSLD